MATRRLEAERVGSKETAEVAAGSPFTLSDVTRLVQALEGTEVRSLLWDRGGEKLVIRRGEAPASVTQVVASAPPIAAAVPAPVAPAPPAPVPLQAAPPFHPAAPAAGEAFARAAEKRGVVVTSPFVGTFYRAPSPDTPPFVEVGSVVKKGQVLCIVEAMKLMNEIEAEVAGRIAEIFVANATPVEFGERLFQIEPA